MVARNLEAPYEGCGEGSSASGTPHGGRLRESRDPAQRFHRSVRVRTPFRRGTAGKSRALMERETMDGVPVRVVIAVSDSADQTDGLVEGSEVALLRTVDDQIRRMFQRVAPRVVSGLIGEPGPQLAGHSPVIDQVEQSENPDRCLQVPDGRILGGGILGGTGAPVRQGPGPIERGNGVQYIGVGRFWSAVHRSEEFRRDSQGIVFEHDPGVPTGTELPYSSGQLTMTRVLHESP